jgi:hypothetical protein
MIGIESGAVHNLRQVNRTPVDGFNHVRTFVMLDTNLNVATIWLKAVETYCPA